MHPEFFNQMTTMHALIMVFGAVMPAFVGLANWMIPMHDRRTRHGSATHEQLVVLDPAGCLRHLLSTLFMPGGARRPVAGPCIRRSCCKLAMRSRS